MPSHVGASRIDKAMLGNQTVSAMYLGTTKVYPNTTKWERYSLVWDFSGEAFGTGQASATKIVDVGSLDIVARAPAVGDVAVSNETNYNAGAAVYFWHLQSLVSGDVYRYNRYANQTKTWLATKRAKGAYIDTVEHIDENAYPVNGIAGEYWYVRK